MDIRQVIMPLIPDKYPLPNIVDMFSKYFSQLDLSSVYHQLLLLSNSLCNCFVTLKGRYQYKRVCLGISSAPSAFQKMLSSILSGINGVKITWMV